MRLRFWKQNPIDMNIEKNFPSLWEKRYGLRNRLRNFRIFRTQPVGRPKELITTILVALGAITAETAAGGIVGIAVGGMVYGLSLSTIYTVATIAAVIGFSAWTMFSEKSGGVSRGAGAGTGAGALPTIDQNGQLVNTRQSSKPMQVIYGVCRVGGNVKCHF